jgi:hypothetical protein
MVLPSEEAEVDMAILFFWEPCSSSALVAE